MVYWCDVCENQLHVRDRGASALELRIDTLKAWELTFDPRIRSDMNDLNLSGTRYAETLQVKGKDGTWTSVKIFKRHRLSG